ncbi:ABC transporter substrate-binding protein [Chelatococcus reniformis]|uniref:Branched-chain amino acid ABC transporter substrate-binding protein n=1 Tax=Chelatococcus reniformis TaxID=1494448 RepID=A0A916XAP6_9HYPH|nr:ABC transporter substrate-binding protein [Chelatococcus reniformis]GGC60144.1 branched-chain amino acid ABC transporter substrate-binding protein [Chelatococcus reniformis]
MNRRDLLTAAAGLALAAPFVSRARAAGKRYDPGASDTEIRLGQTIPYSGAGSPYSVIGRAQTAYFEQLNAKGGVNGRKINFISLDDAYSAPKAVEATRRLVEQDEVLGLFGSLGTAPQSAVQKYLNSKKVPQLLLNTGAPRWNNPKEFPWTTASLPLYNTEGRILGRWLLETKPDGKIAILYQNDEFGREYIKAFREVLGDKAATMIVAEAPYDLTDPTIDSQIIKLKQSGADVLYNVSTGKATSQSLKKVHELGWAPLHLLVSTSTGRSIINAAGPETAKGVVSTLYIKHVGSLHWANDPDVKAFQALRETAMPNVDADNDIAFQGYSLGVLMARILEKCGDELTRENLLKQATNLKGVSAPALLPGLTYAITPTDYNTFSELFIATFNGSDWDASAKPVSQ